MKTVRELCSMLSDFESFCGPNGPDDEFSVKVNEVMEAMPEEDSNNLKDLIHVMSENGKLFFERGLKRGYMAGKQDALDFIKERMEDLEDKNENS